MKHINFNSIVFCLLADTLFCILMYFACIGSWVVLDVYAVGGISISADELEFVGLLALLPVAFAIVGGAIVSPTKAPLVRLIPMTYRGAKAAQADTEN